MEVTSSCVPQQVTRSKTYQRAGCLLAIRKKSVCAFAYPMPLVALPCRVHPVSTMKFLLFAALIACGDARAQNNTKWFDLNAEGIRLIQTGNAAAAEIKFRSALIEAEQFGEQDYRLAANLSNLALAREEQSAYKDAEQLYRRVLELREKYLPPGSVEIASALNNLGGILHNMARDQEADPLLRRGLRIAEDAHDQNVIAATLNTLGLVLAREGEPARAEPVMRRALALFEKIGGPDSLDAGKTLNNLAALYVDQKEFVKAEDAERRAVPIYEKHLPAGHPLIGAVLNNMFVILGGQKRFDEGEPYLRQALEIEERSAPGTVRTEQMRGNLAALEASRGDWQSAADLLERVIAAEERSLGPNHPTLATALANYSEAMKHLNRKAEAKQAERRASAIMKSFRQ